MEIRIGAEGSSSNNQPMEVTNLAAGDTVKNTYKSVSTRAVTPILSGQHCLRKLGKRGYTTKKRWQTFTATQQSSAQWTHHVNLRSRAPTDYMSPPTPKLPTTLKAGRLKAHGKLWVDHPERSFYHP